MTGLPLPFVQFLQVATVAGAAPGVSGFTAWFEARLQGRRGPRVLQPYYDLAKLFGKETVVPDDAGIVFRVAPVASFACYLTVPLLIPVLTSYALPLGYMGDILGGGLILAFASFLVAAAAAETGDAYAQLASSRAKTFAAITEARHWLAERQAEIAKETWQPPAARAAQAEQAAAEAARREVTLGEYAAKWIETRTNSRGEPLALSSQLGWTPPAGIEALGFTVAL